MRAFTSRVASLSGVLCAAFLCAAPLAAQAAKVDTTKHPAGAKPAAAKPPVPPPAAAKTPAGKPAATKSDTTKKAPAKTPAPKPDTSKKVAAKPDSATGTSVSERGGKGQLSIMREVFTYSQAGRRDPFISLMATADIRPMLTEIELIAIIYDEQGSNSEAVLRNLTDKKKLYHVKVGQQLGRMTVAQITRREVIFTINEFGFSNQKSLSIKPDTSAGRTP